MTIGVTGDSPSPLSPVWNSNLSERARNDASSPRHRRERTLTMQTYSPTLLVHTHTLAHTLTHIPSQHRATIPKRGPIPVHRHLTISTLSYPAFTKMKHPINIKLVKISPGTQLSWFLTRTTSTSTPPHTCHPPFTVTPSSPPILCSRQSTSRQYRFFTRT